ncbi:MAG: phosphate signaling complex protein PhoU [Sandaracinaceae bacterium]
MPLRGSPTIRHTDQQFASELRELRDRLLAMGARCEGLILSAVRAVEDGDPALAERVGKADRAVNAEEGLIDDLALRILALRHPLGRDLRFLMTALKVVVDLEQIGDEAVNIAERASIPVLHSELRAAHAQLTEMGRRVAAMLHEALDAFVDEDAREAEAVLRRDDAIDAQYQDILQRTMAFMRGHPEHARSGMATASCAKYLERIADHATNIAEMVIYMVRGVDVRHEEARESERPAPFLPAAPRL